jgi:DUF4097 and DUF4098 domain-containing protein YvlB
MTRTAQRSTRLAPPIGALCTALVGALMGPFAPAAAHAQSDRTRIDSTFAFNKDGSVDVGLVTGEIVITGSTRPEAKVYATIERGWIDASLTSGHIRLMARSTRGRSGGARYEITVPVGTRIEASSVQGSIRITGTNGEVDATAVNGAIEVIGAEDRITVQTVNGRIHAAKLHGRVRLANTSSSIEAEDIDGDVTAGSVSGHITLSGVKSSHVDAETVSGTVSYSGNIDAAGSYEFSTHSGNVHIEIPDNAGAELQLQTFSGRISSAFPITLQPGDITSQHMGMGKKMEFTIGKGGARMTASTFSGNITIDKGGHADRKEN